MAEGGYVLRDDAFTTNEAQSIAGFPGVWERGKALPASVLAAARGETVEQLKAYIEENDLPLDYVSDAELDEAQLAYHGGMFSSAELPSEPMATLPRNASTDPYVPGLTQEEVEAREKWRAERGQPEAMRTMVPEVALAGEFAGKSVSDLRASAGEMTGTQLEALRSDPRKSVQALADREIAKRSEGGES